MQPGAWMSLVIVMCCQVEVSATDRSLMHRCPIKSGVSKCDPESSNTRQTKDVKSFKKLV